MKEFSKFEIASIKRVAQNVSSMVIKKNKIKAQIDKLQEEYDQLVAMQEQYEAPIRTMTGGYSSEDLFERVVENTGKVDKEGRPIKQTKYNLKYPKTVIPVPCDEGTVIGGTGKEAPDDTEAPVTEAPTIESAEHGTEPSDLPFMN